MMRIITGKARGVRLTTLPGEDTTRPTTERVKESVFSALQFQVEGRCVLDLFAGSGQMGLEAMSRGAASCVFVDADRAACDVVRKNAKDTRLEENIRVINSDAVRFLERDSGKYDLVFLDPPYKAALLPQILPLLVAHLRAGATVVCETDANTVLPEQIDGVLTAEKQRRYGKTQVTYYTFADAAERTKAL